MIACYIVIAAVAVLMFGASLVAVFKPGKKDNISKYDNIEE